MTRFPELSLRLPPALAAVVLALGSVPAVPVPAQESAEESAAADESPEGLPSFERPAWDDPRYVEDWSVLAGIDRDRTDDVLDRLKYIPLTADGMFWAGFGGQARLRYESWNNFNFGRTGAADDTDVFLLSRFRYHVDLHATEYVRAFVEGKSSFSTPRDLPGNRRTLDVDELELQNGFVDLNVPTPGVGEVVLRAGRQELLFGKQRLVSPLDWSNTRRSWDGFTAILAGEDYTVAGFYTQFAPVQKYDFNEADGGTEFFGLYGTAALPEVSPAVNLDTDLYFLGLVRDTATFNLTTGEEDRFTIGGRIGGNLRDIPIDFDLEGAYQFGEVGSGDVSAFMITAETGYTAKEMQWTPRVHVGFDYASGDDDPGGDVETFNQLFPLGHAYLGWIDLIGRQNIIDFRSGLTLKPSEKFTVRLHGHYFMRADTEDALYNAGAGVVPGTATSGSRYVGGEIDVLFRYAFTRHFIGYAGYSHFFPDEFIEETGPSEDIDFAYLGAQFTF